MEIGYFLSIVLVLQFTTSMHGMARACYQAITRNSKMLLPTLTTRTAPLFAKKLHTAIPTRNISVATNRVFQYNPSL